MSAPLSPTPNDAAAAAVAAAAAAQAAQSGGENPPAPAPAPAPGTPAPAAQPPASDPAPAPEGADKGTPLSHEDALKELEKVRREAANYRTKVRELEPLAQAAREAEDAKKTELERYQEQNQQLLERLEAAERQALVATHQIPEAYQSLVTGSTPEERAASAQLIGELVKQTQQPAPATAPPSNRPVEGLRPGASPTPPAQPDNSYPVSWLPPAGNQS
ncbi:hypothetical protein [Rhodococcus pyridinivorans]|uniref:hypothetical protein n=1 Tax=Rhodococcus pyridinivorans TaxID=103816 RepID=UPI003AAFDC75